MIERDRTRNERYDTVNHNLRWRTSNTVDEKIGKQVRERVAARVGDGVWDPVRTMVNTPHTEPASPTHSNMTP